MTLNKNTLDDMMSSVSEPELELLLGFMDGTLTPQQHQQALLCIQKHNLDLKPWSPMGDAYTAYLDDAAEAAKPALAKLSDRVLDAVAPPRPSLDPSIFERVVSFLQPYIAFAGAAAAAVFIVSPLVQQPITPVALRVETQPTIPATDVEPEAIFASNHHYHYVDQPLNPTAPQLPAHSPTDSDPDVTFAPTHSYHYIDEPLQAACEIQKLQFENAGGMILQSSDGATLILVTEDEGA